MLVTWRLKGSLPRGVAEGFEAMDLVMDRAAFWQDESYDHWVRSGEEFERIVRYIEANPVRAGLLERVEDWRWSSAFGG